VLLMDCSISSKRNVRAFQATFFEMLSAWSASFLTDMTRISREMNHRACKETRRSLLPMRLRLLPRQSFVIQGYRQPDHFPIADHPNPELGPLHCHFGRNAGEFWRKPRKSKL
jgi:hypothetical protein